MRIDILTLFPEMCESVLAESIIGRARQDGLVEINCTQIRDYSKDKHNRVDDAPYGGGTGMIMQVQPIYDCYCDLCEALGKKIEPNFGPDRKGDIKHSNADISKARNLLGYDPDYDFAKGIALAIDWYKEDLSKK